MISQIRNNLSAKPHICKQYEWWRCFNANAKGSGNTPFAAYRVWVKAYNNFLIKKGN